MTLITLAPRTRGYASVRPYFIPESLSELAGPVDGVHELPVHIYWQGQRAFNLQIQEDKIAFSTAIVQEALRKEDALPYLNRATLMETWTQLSIPVQLRQRWEETFPELARA